MSSIFKRGDFQDIMEKEKRTTILDNIRMIIKMFSQPLPEAGDDIEVVGEENELLAQSLKDIEEKGKKYEDNINKDINDNGGVGKKSTRTSSKKYSRSLSEEKESPNNVEKRDNNGREIEL